MSEQESPQQDNFSYLTLYEDSAHRTLAQLPLAWFELAGKRLEVSCMTFKQRVDLLEIVGKGAIEDIGTLLSGDEEEQQRTVCTIANMALAGQLAEGEAFTLEGTPWSFRGVLSEIVQVFLLGAALLVLKARAPKKTTEGDETTASTESTLQTV